MQVKTFGNKLKPRKRIKLLCYLLNMYLFSKNWKKLIQSKGRSLMFSTSMPLPLAAAAHGNLINSTTRVWPVSRPSNKFLSLNSISFNL